MKIDAHHHFWNYNPVEYDWIDDSMPVIRRSFLPTDLRNEIETAGIDGVVSVQARQTLEETDWLLQLASENDFIKGVVGWLPLADPNMTELLQQYAEFEKLKGIRHIVQGQPAGFLDAPEFNQGISQLNKHDLVYDILIFENQLEEAIRLVDRHPDQPFVLDHIAKPKIKNAQLNPWQKNIRSLAKRDNVSCKLSGMVTEADPQNWNEQQIQPYLETVLSAFGPQRLMFGSDWPVCLLATDYSQWSKLIQNYIAPLSGVEQAAIMGENASRIYKL